MIESNMMIMLVHKIRRAPVGSGRFWSEFQEALTSLLEHHSENRELIERYAPFIANDRGESLNSNYCDVLQMMSLMQQEGKGPIVQLRRWFTNYDASELLDKVWHTLLVALIFLFAAG